MTYPTSSSSIRTHRIIPLLALAAFFSCNHAVLAALPQVDFDRMGKVGLGGAFAGLDLFDNSTVSFDSSTSTVLSRSSNGSLSSLGSTNSGGSISSGCAISDILYVGGAFSSVGGVSAANVAAYDTSKEAFSAMGSGGPNGEVLAMYCDESNNKVWVGGHFTSPGSSVAVWDTSAKSWSAAPFGGLSGAGSTINSITTNSSASSLFFAGSFITSFGGNGTVVNGTNNPNVPYSQGATPYSSSLVPIPLQNAQVQGSPSTSDSQFSNIQNILCPSGADGPGETWFAADGNSAVITARTFTSLSASGVRLGNTFLDGRGTTGFSVTTIPDNVVQTLRYLDPQTGQNQTCSNPCPLLTDSSVLYQDFIFSGPLNITGVQITLSEWQGAGPGLHLMQLLSSGAFVSAVSSQNGLSCFAPSASNTSFTGNWSEKDANTNIAGTVEAVLVSDVAVGTSPAQGPSFTWRPYVSASGTYDVNLLVPGCTAFQNCPLRTSVQVTVFPGGGQQPWVSTVNQQNTEDATTLIYSGPIYPSSPDFVTTVTMTLASNPAGNGQNGQYELVADRVQLVLNSANTTGTTPSSGNGTTGTSGGSSGFGFFEWPLKSSSNVSATSILPNSTETSLDTIGIDLLNGLGGTSSLTSSSSAVAAVAQHPSGTVFIGGSFTLTSGSASGASHIVAYSNGALSVLANNGLNGPVTSLVLDGDTLYAGGSFTDTSSGSTQGLRGVAMYDVQAKQWSAMQAGVNGAVASLSYANGQVQLAGNFTQVLSSSGSSSGSEAAGIAVWDTTQNSWINSGGFLVGKMTFVGNGTAPEKGQNQSQIMAGNVAASLKYGAPGFVMLQTGGSDGVPEVTPLGLELGSDVVSSSTGITTIRRRSHISAVTTGWISNVRFPKLFSRQSASSSVLPTTPPTTAPAVLTGAFWTNSSSGHEVVIIGGNFSYTASSGSSESRGVAIYDPTSSTLTSLQGSQVNGTVRALFVQDDSLYVGGEFTLSGASVSGFAVYDLVQQQWASSQPPSLSLSSGTPLVRSISASASSSSLIIVAGTFSTAGSLACNGICSWNKATSSWAALGNGIQGEVSSVAYAGSNRETLVASGVITLSDSTSANVAQYTFSNTSWAAVGNGADIPGPVTAVEVDNGNSSSIFAAGRSSDGSSSFLSFWNGAQWTTVGSTLGSTTNVSQLTMVPLQNTHSANGIIEPDRMLLVSGFLANSSFGNASSALFDGQNFIPYIMTATASGDPGVVSQLFYSLTTFSFTQKHFLAVGIVILISIAIGAGIVFLLVLIGILWTLFARRDETLAAKYDTVEDDDASSAQHRPSSLLAHINAATRNTIIGSTSPFGAFSAEKEEETGGTSRVISPEDPNFARADTPSDAVIGGTTSDVAFRPSHARYSFDGTGEGELAVRAGQELHVLDDGDESWWFARDPRTGEEGVVPAAYLY
ncbi:hypothetical protein NEOLEDRAFT_1076882 [Neolentinus lepideus HHB14362 ss-1]|uniref:SH3 domain-containing protein n=1 Tax=Neolentinus lepideus HHB14362 ss-1 TaxID=1314782 RepID=A0A165NNS2_9AGAM|nr:hypothetical protein NEOLEDRAFT_1076882 [Neolentinus lepideus HHB14362 ss-1]